MPELETSRQLSRAEVAAYLREFADELDRKDDTTARQREGEAQGPDTTGRTTDTRTTKTNTESTRTPPTDTVSTTPDETADAADSPDATDTADVNTVGTADAADATGSDRPHSATDYRKVTFLVGNDSATINPPETVSFDVAVDSDSSLMEAGTRERVDFSIAWNADDVPEDDELRIE
ncbi:hypothetical protein [Haloprofundus salilacus]|uniref:hypothetical protein n=1 Tax=Haloprofundus salilacus TaxID=2876190 RepID=UPI001CD02545|nr:hypothetical protein [Haloprofundus salilacus]